MDRNDEKPVKKKKKLNEAADKGQCVGAEGGDAMLVNNSSKVVGRKKRITERDNKKPVTIH